jgi:hypothetical protein
MYVAQHMSGKATKFRKNSLLRSSCAVLTESSVSLPFSYIPTKRAVHLLDVTRYLAWLSTQRNGIRMTLRTRLEMTLNNVSLGHEEITDRVT